MPKDGKPYSLGYRKDGKFVEEFGSSFYDEATNLAFDILQLFKNRINVVVFTKNKSILDFGKDKADVIIKNTLLKVTGMKPNVTFVTSNDNDKIPHDRFIITNYRLIRSGDSFLYFDPKGKKITNGGALDIDSMANHETYTFVQSLLEKLQASYDDIKRLNNDMIIGSQESKYIQFNN